MKTRITVILAAIAAMFYLPMIAAAAQQVPAGTYVTAECNGDNTATVFVTGVDVVKYEKYDYIDEVPLGAVQEVTHNLDAGRRFNFTFGKGAYALLTPEMAIHGVAFIGDNLGLDCRNSRGCTFIITCPNVVVSGAAK